MSVLVFRVLGREGLVVLLQRATTSSTKECGNAIVSGMMQLFFERWNSGHTSSTHELDFSTQAEGLERERQDQLT